MAEDRRVQVAPSARDQAIEKLQDHYAHNHLEVEDFERLVELAERARSNDDLAVLFNGLPSLDAPVVAGKVTASVKATLGATSRRGRWRVPSLVKVKALLGSVDLDLCDADLIRGETVIEVSAVLGSITIVVPEGLAVECEGGALLGSFDHVVQGAASRKDGRLVRIVGKATLGSVDVIVKKKAGVLEDLKRTVRGLLGP